MADGDNLVLGTHNSATKKTRLSGGLPSNADDFNSCLELTSKSIGLKINSDNTGVVAIAQTGNGLYGQTHHGFQTQRSFAGVLGVHLGDGLGVHGFAKAGRGVQGMSDDGVGVFGRSETYHGVIGVGDLNGVYGFSKAGTGVVGQTFGRERDGAFGVFAWGNMGCTGPKHAAVLQPGGAYRLLYSIESPECWFEDFGSGRIRRGRVTVTIPKDFKPLVKTSGYHVFLTPEGDCRGLFVSRKSSRSFEVRESGGGRSNIRFSYRIVAKRGDIPGPRLPKVRLVKPDPVPARDPKMIAPRLSAPLRRGGRGRDGTAR